MGSRTLVTRELRDTAELHAMRVSLRAALSSRADNRVLADVVVATQEAVANSLRSSDAAARPVNVYMHVDDEYVWVDVSDAGRGPAPARVERIECPPLESTNGRGLFLMRALMDVLEVSTYATGSRVRMGKRLTA